MPLQDRIFPNGQLKQQSYNNPTPTLKQVFRYNANYVYLCDDGYYDHRKLKILHLWNNVYHHDLTKNWF